MYQVENILSVGIHTERGTKYIIYTYNLNFWLKYYINTYII